MAKRSSGFSGSCASTSNALLGEPRASPTRILPTYVSIAFVSLAATGTYKHGSRPDVCGIRTACGSIGRRVIGHLMSRIQIIHTCKPSDHIVLSSVSPYWGQIIKIQENKEGVLAVSDAT